MIVKNEEKNIEKALDWAKTYAFEQIVVDTGSTDKTVELAEKMGAKIYHFKWIDDFSAAKNFAMDKATGNWIAILDADEYIPPEDMPALMSLLETSDEYDAVSCPRWNLSDNNNVNSIIRTSRFFKNRSDLRYKGRIHEQVTVKGKRLDADNIRIMHTGYIESEIEGTSKAKRNIGILREELAADPDNITIKAFLADSLWMDPNEKSQNEAYKLFREVVDSMDVAPGMKKPAYSFIINKYLKDPQKENECEEMCHRARTEFPDDIDFKFFHGAAMNGRGEYKPALELLSSCIDKLDVVADYGGLSYVSADPTMLFNQILYSAQSMGDIGLIIIYATIALKYKKTDQTLLSSYIAALLVAGKTDDEILGFLSDVYDIKNLVDLMLIARAAKDRGAIDFAKKVIKIATSL